jgi:hypothetical protein
MTYKEFRAWLDAKARDMTLAIEVQSAFYELQQTFESDFDYPLGSVIFDARNALDYHKDRPNVVAAYQQFLDEAALVVLTPEEVVAQTPVAFFLTWKIDT